MGKTLVLCLGTACVAFAMGWVLRGRTGLDSATGIPVRQASSMASHEESRVSVDALTTQGRQGPPIEANHPIEPELPKLDPPPPDMQTALADLDRAIRLRPIYEDRDAEFAAKYEGASAAALREALKLVQTRVESEQESIIKDRIAAGQYDEHVIADGERGPSMKGKGKGLSTFGYRKEPGPNGTWVVKTTEITAEEYPEFNSGRMEMWWLIRAVRGK